MDNSSHIRKVQFEAFDPTGDVDRTFRKLPHWFQPGVAVFLTFRTFDSMPKEVLQRWQQEQEAWLKQHGLSQSAASDLTQFVHLPSAMQREFRRTRDQLWHRSLDDCHGKCVLRRPELAQVVGDTLRYFDGVRYDLDSFIVMPNHVHLLVQFRPPTTLKIQCQSWLRYSARRINEHLGLRGPFWQSEPFDHLVRSSEQFTYLHRYIVENSAKARLKVGDYLYWSRVTRLSES